MSKAGDVFENPITGERAVIRVGTEESGGELLVADLYVSPGGRVAAEHVHPILNEWFTVLRGEVGFRLNGRESVAKIGERLHVPPGTVHDWWNAGEEEAHVVLEVSSAARFEEAISTTFGLARDGKRTPRGCRTSCSSPSCRASSRTCCTSPNPRAPSRRCSSPLSRP